MGTSVSALPFNKKTTVLDMSTFENFLPGISEQPPFLWISLSKRRRHTEIAIMAQSVVSLQVMGTAKGVDFIFLIAKNESIFINRNSYKHKRRQETVDSFSQIFVFFSLYFCLFFSFLYLSHFLHLLLSFSPSFVFSPSSFVFFFLFFFSLFFRLFLSLLFLPLLSSFSFSSFSPSSFVFFFLFFFSLFFRLFLSLLFLPLLSSFSFSSFSSSSFVFFSIFVV
ncbi:unnamed protein product [Acanthosepion pharaonis]|uniref:Uncharacterized protein n=1 Tax=Acanthosepion pharaonis TaxID=158019 RepID=A0A812E1U2_ACAPH|nr:unnamed protein product [Sepia pharaonis]